MNSDGNQSQNKVRKYDDGPRMEAPDWLDDIDIEVFEDLAGMNYSLQELAMYFDIPWSEFKKYFYSFGSVLKYHFDRGILKCKAEESLRMQRDSSTGDNMANAQRFDKKRYEDAWQRTLNEVVYGNI